jgi:hypothetical protein
VRNTDGATHHIGHCENLEDLFGGDIEFMAFAEVILDTIIAAQHHGSYQSEHLLGLHIECSLLIGLVIETPEAFDNLVVLRHQTVVHAGAVIVELFYDRHDLNSFAVIYFTIRGKSRFFPSKAPVILP